MDSTGKIAAAGIIGAVITAAATIYGAHINVVKPTERQVVGSDIFQDLAKLNAGLQADVRDARKRADALEEQNRSLRDTISQFRTSRESTPSLSDEMGKKTEQRVKELIQKMQDLEAENTILRQQIRTYTASSATRDLALQTSNNRAARSTRQAPSESASSVERRELTLIPSQAMQLTDEVTITAVPFNPAFGLTVLVNGKKSTGLQAGERVPISKTASEACFLEVMSLPTVKQTSAPSDIRVDYVCRTPR